MTRITAYLQQEVLQFAEALFPFYWTRRSPHSHPYANCNSSYHTHNSTVPLIHSTRYLTVFKPWKYHYFNLWFPILWGRSCEGAVHTPHPNPHSPNPPPTFFSTGCKENRELWGEMGLTGFGMVFSFFYFIVTRLLGSGTVAREGERGTQNAISRCVLWFCWSYTNRIILVCTCSDLKQQDVYI